MPSPRPPTATFTAALQRARAQFHPVAEAAGFVRTPKNMWVRQHEHTVEWFSLFRSSSYRNSVDLRMESGLRVLNSPRTSLTAFGPRSLDARLVRPDLRLHMSFNVITDSMYERSVADAGTFFQEILCAWFQPLQDMQTLLATPIQGEDERILPGTAMAREEMPALVEALAAGPDPERVAVSLKLLGIKPPREKRAAAPRRKAPPAA